MAISPQKSSGVDWTGIFANSLTGEERKLFSEMLARAKKIGSDRDFYDLVFAMLIDQQTQIEALSVKP